MRDLHQVLERLQSFRGKFERLLATARKKADSAGPASARRPTRLRELAGFGANPGNLRLFAYVPEHPPRKPPLRRPARAPPPAPAHPHPPPPNDWDSKAPQAERRERKKSVRGGLRF